MRRGSIIGPVILILIGVVFLLNNIRPEFSMLRLVADFWPFILIAWGAIRIVEITLLYSRQRPLPERGISGGEWVFIVFLCLLGSGAMLGYRVKDRWPDAKIRMRGLDLLGESYDYPIEYKPVGVGATPRILVENLRGNARITGVEGDQIKASGRNSVRAFSQEEADKVRTQMNFEIVRQGNLWVIRTNQDRTSGLLKISSDLEIQVPKGTILETRGRYGDFDITGISGPVVVDSDNAGVRINDVAGDVRVETRKSEGIRVVNCRGSVELKGNGSDVELENIAGQTSITGNFSGDLNFRNLAKPVRYESSATDFRAERVPGTLEFTRGQVSADNIVGPLSLKSRSKDVQISNFTSTINVNVDRGDVELRPGAPALAKMDVQTRSGNITVSMPATASFRVKAETDRGEIEQDFGDSIRITDRGAKHGATAEGSMGSGPEIQLRTNRGQIAIRRAGPGAPMPPAPPRPPAPKVSQF